jgi:hypothetical protein
MRLSTNTAETCLNWQNAGANRRERRFSKEKTALLFPTVNKRRRVKKREFKAAVLFALETGMRIGEMRESLDMLKWYVHLRTEIVAKLW